MLGQLTKYNDADTCNWCEKEAEGITVEFAGNFLQKGHFCFKCFQQAVRVHHKQHQVAEAPSRTFLSTQRAVFLSS